MKLRINTHWENDLYNRVWEDFYFLWKSLILYHFFCQECTDAGMFSAFCICLHEPKFSENQIVEDIKDLNHVVHFSKSRKIWFRWCGYHELSQYFANVSCFALILWWKCCMGGSGTLVGPIGIRNQGSASKKNSLAIVSLSQWQHLSRHSHSECSAWRSWILQSENSRIQNQDIWTHAWLALVSSSKKTWNDFEFGALSCRREEWSLLSLKWNYPRPFLTRTNSSWTHSAT